jgi:hypothetical protein
MDKCTFLLYLDLYEAALEIYSLVFLVPCAACLPYHQYKNISHTMLCICLVFKSNFFELFKNRTHYMFKKLEDLSKPTLLSKTAAKDIRAQAIKTFPLFEDVADDILPKKGSL